MSANRGLTPLDAMHPHELQSGFPPNWQGVIFVFRSAEIVCVVSAKMQSSGLCGGVAICRIKPSGMSSFRNCLRSSIKSVMARARSSFLNIS